MIVVTGGAGLVGAALAPRFASLDDVEVSVRSTPAAPDLRARRIELSDVGAVRAWFRSVRPSLVVHTAYSTVDLQRDVVAATDAVAEAAAGVDARLVVLSTDAVFDGETGPFGEDDVPRPVHAYGRAKVAAEIATVRHVPDAAIVRCSLILSRRPLDGFSRWLVDSVAAQRAVRLYADEFRNAIRLEDVVAAVEEISVRADAGGVWHLGGPERLSRPQIGERLARYHGLDLSAVEIAPSPSGGPTRPRDLDLRCDRLSSLSVRPSPVCSIGPHGETRW